MCLGILVLSNNEISTKIEIYFIIKNKFKLNSLYKGRKANNSELLKNKIYIPAFKRQGRVLRSLGTFKFENMQII